MAAKIQTRVLCHWVIFPAPLLNEFVSRVNSARADWTGQLLASLSIHPCPRRPTLPPLPPRFSLWLLNFRNRGEIGCDFVAVVFRFLVVLKFKPRALAGQASTVPLGHTPAWPCSDCVYLRICGLWNSEKRLFWAWKELNPLLHRIEDDPGKSHLSRPRCVHL